MMRSNHIRHTMDNIGLDIKLIRVTNDQIKNIPTEVMFSRFDPSKSDINYVAIIRFHKNIAFYNTCKYFMQLEMEKSIMDLKLLIHGSNRIEPSQNLTTTIDDAIVTLLKRKALIEAQGKSYQFFRVILIFNDIYDKPQDCCCGLLGFSDYDLYKKSRHIVKVLDRRIKTDVGACSDTASVYVEFNQTKYLERHGSELL